MVVYLGGKMIEVKNLTKTYEKNRILNDVNILFPTNKINFILGKNGVGKTTLFKCILNLEKYEGKINLSRNKIFCMFDNPPFYNNLNGLENIELITQLYGLKKKEYRIDKTLLSEVLLKRKVKYYSYGQRKKLVLAIIDILQPDILLLDEASNGLDYDTIRYLKDRLIIWKQSMTILITGHQLDFYEKVSENIFVIKNQNIFEVKNKTLTLEELYDKYVK